MTRFDVQDLFIPDAARMGSPVEVGQDENGITNSKVEKKAKTFFFEWRRRMDESDGPKLIKSGYIFKEGGIRCV